MKKINSSLFKSVMSKFPTGVAIITINNNNNYFGKTVNSFASVSLNPPLVLFSLEKQSSSLKDYTKSSFFGINILSRKQKKLSIFFSKLKPKWENTKFFLSKNKIPLIEGSVANLNCKNNKTCNLFLGDANVKSIVNFVLKKGYNKNFIFQTARVKKNHFDIMKKYRKHFTS